MLLQAIQEGASVLLWQENFAYATGWDEAKQRYLGLKAGPNESFTAMLSSQSLLVKSEVAQRQLYVDEEARKVAQIKQTGSQGSTGDKTSTVREATITTSGNGTGAGGASLQLKTNKVRHFYGSVQVDPVRLTRDAGQIATEVLQHLVSLVGADVQVTIELQAQVPEGVPEHVVRTITENCRVLKFESYEFEQD